MYGSFFSHLPLSVFSPFRPPARSVAQMTRTDTLYICAAGCIVRCGYWLRFSTFSKKSNYIPSTLISSLHFLNLLYLLACRAPQFGYKPFNEKLFWFHNFSLQTIHTAVGRYTHSPTPARPNVKEIIKHLKQINSPFSHANIWAAISSKFGVEGVP